MLLVSSIRSKSSDNSVLDAQGKLHVVPYGQGAVAGIRLWEGAELGQRLPPEESLEDTAKAISEILDLSGFSQKVFTLSQWQLARV